MVSPTLIICTTIDGNTLVSRSGAEIGFAALDARSGSSGSPPR